MAPFERDTLFANHVIVRLIGAGRIADVYEAVAPGGHDRAFKVVREAVVLSAKPQVRLGQEGVAIAAIDSVHVLAFYGVPTWRSRVAEKTAAVVVAEDERGSTTVPVEAGRRGSRGPRGGGGLGGWVGWG